MGRSRNSEVPIIGDITEPCNGVPRFHFFRNLGLRFPLLGYGTKKYLGTRLPFYVAQAMFLNSSTLLFFSDYRAELYTRLVIEESKKEARKTRTKGSRAAPQAQRREVGSSWCFSQLVLKSTWRVGEPKVVRFLAWTSFLQQMFIYSSNASR